MSEFESKALYELHLQLLAFEAQVLLRRVLFGPEIAPAELLAADPAQVDELLGTEAVRADPRWFKNPRDFANIHKRVGDKPAPYGLPPDRIPEHLPRPIPNAVPAEVIGIGFSNLLAGLFTVSMLSSLYCFGGVGAVQWLEQAVFAKIDGVDEKATSGALMLLLMAQWGLLMLTGPIRMLGGTFILLIPRSALGIGLLLILEGLLGLFVLDIPGFLVSVVTVWWLSRQHVRDYLL